VTSYSVFLWQRTFTHGSTAKVYTVTASFFYCTSFPHFAQICSHSATSHDLLKGIAELGRGQTESLKLRKLRPGCLSLDIGGPHAAELPGCHALQAFSTQALVATSSSPEPGLTNQQRSNCTCNWSQVEKGINKASCI
jgi:hypothetical protein